MGSLEPGNATKPHHVTAHRRDLAGRSIQRLPLSKGGRKTRGWEKKALAFYRGVLGMRIGRACNSW